MNKYIKWFFFLLSVFFYLPCAAQEKPDYPGFNDEIPLTALKDSSTKSYIDSILIIGNRKTKNYIILRELKIKTGDSIITSNLFSLIEDSRSLLYNTNLFSEVSIVPLLGNASKIKLLVTVKERWYIYPSPVFKLTDRNINEWLKVFNADLNRINYGVKFSHFNFSGRNDKLNMILLNGFSRNFAISYNVPYIDQKLTRGISAGFFYQEAREFPYKTSYNNLLLQFKRPSFVRQNISLFGSYSIRKGYYRKHTFSLSYNYINVDDSVINSKYNSNYFNGENSTIWFPDIGYNYQYINTDNINYPLKGKIYYVGITKRGWGLRNGVDMLMLDGVYKKYFTHNKNYYSSVQFYGKLKLPFRQAYINQRALGYTNLYLRGLEYYVIDGVITGLAKYTFSKKLIAFKIPFPFNIKELPYIPLSFYAKTYTDAGYCYNKEDFNTKLNNRLLYTTGFGIDMLSIYDVNVSFEYSFNQLGEKGLFLHFKSSF